MKLAIAVAGLLVAGAAWGQEPKRPSEQEIFGAPAQDKPAAEQPKQEPKPEEPKQAAPPAETPSPAQPEPPPSTPENQRDSRDEAIMGAGAQSRLSEEAAPEDPLKLGGMFYLRSQTTALQGEDPQKWALSAPTLLDAFLDARPNERVRGFIQGRMTFDSTLPPESAGPGPSGEIGTPETSGSTMGTAELSSLFAPRTRGPHVALDQMWLRFDILHTVFVTAGTQHARWGTGRFWSPSDFLHVRRRNPLDVFDARVGTTMLKLHAPWEARGWNFYAYGLLEDTGAVAQTGDVAGAGRAEVVLGTAEIGAGALVQRGRKPKIAIDASAGIWELDFYGELALRYGSEIDRVSYAGDIMPVATSLPQLIDMLYPVDRDPGVKPQAVGGLTYARKYNDNDVFYLGAEYFYNGLGYGQSDVYPGLVLPHSTPLSEPATFFYLGRHYGALFFSLPAPYSWDYTTFTLSTLGNFSDRSFITRLDYSLLILTHLRFEAFAAIRYGDEEGEFRFGVKDLNLGGVTFNRAPALLDLGLALRVSI